MCTFRSINVTLCEEAPLLRENETKKKQNKRRNPFQVFVLTEILIDLSIKTIKIVNVYVLDE